MENNDEKVKLMIEKLSDERKKRLEEMMKQSAEAIKNNNFNINNQYTVEITEKFDKEEPIQFVWMKLNVFFAPTQIMTMTPQGIQAQMGIMFKVLDIEIYSQSDINGWLDHVDRINKQNSLYLEKEGIKQNKDKGNIIIEEKNSKNEVKTINPNPSTNQPQSEEEGYNDDELTEEQRIIEQQYYFMPLFTDINPVKKSNKEYIDTYTRMSKNFANRIMQTHIYGSFETRDIDYNYIHQSLVMMISEFDMCDFTSFTKSELEMFGFTNWRNRMMMIPLWAFPIVLKNNDGLKVYDIHNQEYIIGKDFIEEVNKNGCMAVGFKMNLSEDNYEFVFEYEKNS